MVSVGAVRAIVEVEAVPGVQIALRRDTLRIEYIVFGQFNVPVSHLVQLFLTDRLAVDEVAGRDQHTVDEQRVIG